MLQQKRVVVLCLLGMILGRVFSTSSPTPAPTIWWQNEFFYFTYFELYFIGTAILIGGFLVCFTLCMCLEDHPLSTVLKFSEDYFRVRSKRMDERFKESTTLLGKGTKKSDA